MSEGDKTNRGNGGSESNGAAAPPAPAPTKPRPSLLDANNINSSNNNKSSPEKSLSSSMHSKTSTTSSRNMKAPGPPKTLPKGKAPPPRVPPARSKSGSDITKSKSSRNLNATLAGAPKNSSKGSLSGRGGGRGGSGGSSVSSMSTRNFGKGGGPGGGRGMKNSSNNNKGRGFGASAGGRPGGLYNKELSSRGIKYGVTAVSRADMVDQESSADDMAVYWEDEGPKIKNPVWRVLRNILVFMHCMPATLAESTPLKNWLRFFQWMALLADIAAALVAIITFQDVSYCCGHPMMDIVVSFNWKKTIRIATYIWLVCVVLQIYPVVKKGIPFNVVNPFIGFFITCNMFFYDSKYQALWMWCVETFAISCELSIYLLKKNQKISRNKEVRRVGLMTQKLRNVEEGEDPDKAELELKRTRQKYYQLKKEQEFENKLLHWLILGLIVNTILAVIVLILIIFISIAQGICVSSDAFPNPFSTNQGARCPKCADQAGNNCQYCSEDLQQCYFAYNGGGSPILTYDQNGTVYNQSRW